MGHKRKVESQKNPKNKVKKKAFKRQNPKYLIEKQSQVKLFGIIFLISLPLFGVLFYTYNIAYEKDEISKALSAVIFHQVDANLRFIQTLEAIRSLIVEEPLADLIKTKLRPVQERISSLRTQTSMYEKMEHIPGGPTNFMSTTLKELDKIVAEQVFPLQNQVFSILVGYQHRAYNLARLSNELAHSQLIITMDMLSPQMNMLEKEGIYLYPSLELSNPNLIDELKENLTLFDVTKKLTRLTALYKAREDTFLKIVEQYESDNEGFKRDVKSISRMQEEIVYLPQYSHLAHKLIVISNLTKTEIKKEGKYYQLTHQLRSEVAGQLISLTEQLVHIHNTKRDPYLNLESQILKDIDHLKIRVFNLQYKYVKIQQEI